LNSCLRTLKNKFRDGLGCRNVCAMGKEQIVSVVGTITEGGYQNGDLLFYWKANMFFIPE